MIKDLTLKTVKFLILFRITSENLKPQYTLPLELITWFISTLCAWKPDYME